MYIYGDYREGLFRGFRSCVYRFYFTEAKLNFGRLRGLFGFYGLWV